MKAQKSLRAGFSLVEVAFALGLASFCLFTLLGLLSVGITTSKTTSSETKAVNLMGQVLGDLRAGYASTPASASSPFYQIPLPAAGAASTMTSNPATRTLYLTEDGKAAAAVGTYSSSAQFRVTVGFAPQVAATGSQTIMVRVLVTWPVQVDTNPAVWPSNYTGSVETVAAIRTTPW
jgi:uncharacterized protein (TIGR02598 family)